VIKKGYYYLQLMHRPNMLAGDYRLAGGTQPILRREVTEAPTNHSSKIITHNRPTVLSLPCHVPPDTGTTNFWSVRREKKGDMKPDARCNDGFEVPTSEIAAFHLHRFH